MMFICRQFLTFEEVTNILTNLGDWKEGFTNAGKHHKDNYEQVKEDSSRFISRKIQQHALATNRLFIKRMTLPRFNLYKAGQKYNKHVDAFKQEGIQTDWSYTLILQAPLKGGELEVEIDGRIVVAELKAGDIVFYPSGNIHRVIPVEEGERIAAIGWIESLISDRDRRAIISRLVDVMQTLDNKDGHVQDVLNLSYVYHNLMRLWSK